MRKITFITIGLLLLSIKLYSQTDFRKGYLITNDNDTLHGFIDYRSEHLNCAKCVFKIELDDKSVTYLPGEIKAYRFIDDKYYISSYIGALQKEVFLEYLIDGIVDLFYYRELQDKFYFVSKEESEYHLLENEEIETVIDGKTYVRTSNKHIGLLNYFFSDSKEVLKKVNNVELKHKSLIEIAKDYHNDVCSDQECMIFEKKISPIRVEFSGLIFTSYNSLEIKNFGADIYGLGATQFEKFNYQNDFSYNFGLGTSFYIPRLNQRFSIYLQFLYGQNYFYASYVDEVAGNTVYNYSHYTFNHFTRELGVKYIFPKGKIRPEFFVAYSQCLIFYSKDSKMIEETLFSDNTVEKSVFTKDLPGSPQGLTLGAGLNFYRINKIDFILNLQYNFHFSSSKVRMNSTRLGLGINF